MALMLTRAKRTLGAFIFSILMYLFPSLSGGCNVADLKDGGAESSDVQGSDDGAVADGAVADAGAADYGNQCAAYGPPPCSSDSDCQTYGAGWYCDKTNTESFCGGDPQSYPICKQAADAGPADIGYEDYGTPCADYGPRSCSSDQDCRDEHDAGNWYCDRNHQVPSCNGQPMTWPTCVEGTDIDAGPADYGSPCAAYGPQPAPCQSDQQCVTTYGAGWYCDKNHQVDNCGTTTTVPTCVPGGDS